MKKMTIEEIHDELLDVLQVLHDFCVAHGIRYMLHGGTLIGAVRHKGFIPWDDDADVSMPRLDYERFIKEFPDSDEYKLFAPQKGNSLLVYSRLCEMKRTYFKAVNPWCFEDAGLGVDIFPLDGFDAEGPQQLAPIVTEARRLQKLTWSCRTSPWANIGFIHSILRTVRHPIVILRYLNRVRYIARIQKKHHKLISSSDYETSKLCAQLGNPNAGVREFMPREWVREFLKAPYEDREFFIPIEYDKILTRWYGDYMKIPPEENRITHDTVQTMMWRDK